MTTTTTSVTVHIPTYQIPRLLCAHALGISDDAATAVLWTVTVIVSGTLWYIRHRHNNRRRSPRGMPVLRTTAQGRSYPWIGHGLTFLRYPPWDLLTLWHREYGRRHNNDNDDHHSERHVDGAAPTPSAPVVAFTLLGTSMVSVASPEVIRSVLQSQVGSFQKDIQNVMRPFLSILGTGIVSSEGSAWLKQRLKMSHPLRRNVLDLIPAQTLTAVQRLCATLDEASDQNKPVPLGSLLRHLTLQVISGSFLSLDANESDSTFAKLYLPIVEECNQRVWHPYRRYLFFMPSFWTYHWNVYSLNSYVSSLVRTRWEQRRQRLDHPHSKMSTSAPAAVAAPKRDILDTVLDVYDTEGRTTLSNAEVRQVRDEMKTFMLAGHETSAAMMTWTLYEVMTASSKDETTMSNSIGASSQLLERLRKEANAVFDPSTDWREASETSIPDSSELAKLVVSEASLRESLRKYSVVPISARVVVQDVQVGDYFIPRGCSIMVNLQAVHLDPNIWPQPMAFDPSRFLPDRDTDPVFLNSSTTTHVLKTNTSNKPIQPFTYLPFIAGPRNCLGQHLALLESKMVISLLVQRYQFSLRDQTPTDPTDWSKGKDPRHRYMVPVVPKEELMVSVLKR